MKMHTEAELIEYIKIHLEKDYEANKTKEHIQKPLAYTLYQLWSDVDSVEQPKSQKNQKQGGEKMGEQQ